MLAGCGTRSGGGAAGAVDADSLARVRPVGDLVVSSSNEVPYVYRDPKTSQVAGTHYDIDRAIADRLGVKAIELYEVPIAGIIAALNAKRCDMISVNLAKRARHYPERPSGEEQQRRHRPRPGHAAQGDAV